MVCVWKMKGLMINFRLLYNIIVLTILVWVLFMAIKPNYYIHRSRTLAVKCLEKAKNVQIRVGMTREELERYYHHDGGIYFLDDEPYVFRCDTKGITAVKISVAFDRVSPPTDNKLDRIKKVAGPGIGESHAD